MAVLDWIVVALFITATLVTGLWFARRASKSTDEFFVAGRTIPWWLAGTSMLATSFASDTPLHTTRMIREHGLGGAWFYWGGIFSGVLIAFFFSRLWRRTGVTTDNELIELRYTGKRAAALRGGLALFKSLFLEILTMAWITLGMVKIVKAIMGLPDTVVVPVLGAVPSDVVVVAVLLVVTVIFSMASGFWGVVSTDLAEFSMAMTGAVVLAFVAVDAAGGSAGLRDGLKHARILGETLVASLPFLSQGGDAILGAALGLLPLAALVGFPATAGASKVLDPARYADLVPIGERGLDFFPSLSAESVSILAFCVYLGVQWWAQPGIDGSGQRAQRLLACKNEKHAIAAGVWSLAVTWLIRSWPWYLTALASVILFPFAVDGESVYPEMVARYLPIGLKGLMVASFVSAFMGTMEAHYNLCASYAQTDIYQRFIKKDGTPRHYVKASRWMTLAVALLAGGTALVLPSVLGAFRFKMELVSGLGLILILRWVWWRVNATTEIVALVTSVAAVLFLNAHPATSGGGAHGSATRLLIAVGVSAVASIAATFLSRPEPRDHLVAFYRRVRPPGAWGPIAEAAGGRVATGYVSATVLAQIALTLVFVFSGMIGLGKLLLGETVLGASLLLVFAVTAWATIRSILAQPGEEAVPAGSPTAGPAAADEAVRKVA